MDKQNSFGSVIQKLQVRSDEWARVITRNPSLLLQVHNYARVKASKDAEILDIGTFIPLLRKKNWQEKNKTSLSALKRQSSASICILNLNKARGDLVKTTTQTRRTFVRFRYHFVADKSAVACIKFANSHLKTKSLSRINKPGPAQGGAISNAQK